MLYGSEFNGRFKKTLGGEPTSASGERARERERVDKFERREREKVLPDICKASSFDPVFPPRAWANVIRFIGLPHRTQAFVRSKKLPLPRPLYSESLSNSKTSLVFSGLNQIGRNFGKV